MKLARVRSDQHVHLARLEEGKKTCVLLHQESDHPAADALREALAGGVDLSGDGPRVALSAVDLLAPVARPSKVLAIGLNYADHAEEANLELPESPVLFVKTPNSIIGPSEEVVWSGGDSTEVDFEGELAVVIGRRASTVTTDPLSYVLGYTCCNDMSARDAQFADGQWVRGKSFDTFCPLGPWIVTTDEIPDPQTLPIGTDVNHERLQDSNTDQMIFGVADLIVYLSRFLTLEPGDVIATGTPYGVGFARTPPRYLSDGDEVTVWIEGIGELHNRMVSR